MPRRLPVSVYANNLCGIIELLSSDYNAATFAKSTTQIVRSKAPATTGALIQQVIQVKIQILARELHAKKGISQKFDSYH